MSSARKDGIAAPPKEYAPGYLSRSPAIGSITALLVFFMVTCAAFLVAHISSNGPQVILGNTTVSGHRDSQYSVDFFGGIPYAEPPIGDLRLRPPVEKRFFDVQRLDAQTPAKACIQVGLPAFMMTEDCLKMNIYRPSGTVKDDNLPVMIWVHGGGFVIGYASRYNGAPLVVRSIERGTPAIVITINYRLGPLGFPQGAETVKEGALNLGLKDILVALEWIKTHIHEFGGDPNKVTVFGESAGARAIEILLLDGHLKDLIRGAIIQSSVTVPTVPPTTPERDSAWSGFVNATNCTDISNGQLDCIGTLNTQELLDAYVNNGITLATCTNWFPNLDDELIPTYPSVMDAESAKGIAVIVGANLDEATFITPQAISSTEQIHAMLTALLSPSPRGSDALSAAITKILDLYPDIPSLGSPFGTGNEIFDLNRAYKRYAAIATDLLVHANRRMFLRKLNKAGIKAYSYLFTDPDAASVFPPEFIIQTPKPGSFGVPHAAEIPYVFGTIAQENNTKTPSSAAGNLSDMMMDYWISFATSLDPNDGKGSTRPLWPVYSQAENGNVTHILQLEGVNTRVITDYFRERQIAFFNEDPVMWSR